MTPPQRNAATMESIPGYEYLGRQGHCWDAARNIYPYIVIQNITNEVACAQFCDVFLPEQEELPSSQHLGTYRGFDGTLDSERFCRCNFDAGSDLNTILLMKMYHGNVTAMDIDVKTDFIAMNDAYKGYGEISTTSDVRGVFCYRVVVEKEIEPEPIIPVVIGYDHVGEGWCLDQTRVGYPYILVWINDLASCGVFCDGFRPVGGEYRGFTWYATTPSSSSSSSSNNGYCYCFFDSEADINSIQSTYASEGVASTTATSGEGVGALGNDRNGTGPIFSAIMVDDENINLQSGPYCFKVNSTETTTSPQVNFPSVSTYTTFAWSFLWRCMQG